ncbi:transcription factor [Ganoderma sinense ZZ0214-1]|uniref:Transcription factor n=1 Tax=Ganoderma sinense ZZ0214-1 TaxID=1077348 RepID=A0A2G8RTC8_9APHY|nr:transcription factor [Ganoderma sinense ZZ0214-1]
MLQDTSLNSRGSQTSSPRDQPAQFPNLVVFPPELDNPTRGEQEPLDWLDNLSNDEDKRTIAPHVASIPLTLQTSANPHDNIEQIPYQQELALYSLSSPVWSTTESGFSSPAYTLPRTPINPYPTPVLGSQHLHPYYTPPITPAQQSNGGSRVVHPTRLPLALPATISSFATVGTDAQTRDVTCDIHAARHHERSPLPQPRLSSSFGLPFPSSAYGTQETSLQLTLHQPMPSRAGGSALQLVCYGSAATSRADSDATPYSYNFIPYGSDGQINGTEVAAEVEASKDGSQNMSSSVNPAKKAKKNFACSQCSRAFARTQDLTRHMKTVHSEGKQWVCCGVPMSDAQDYKISADAVTIGPMEHEGVLMIGGCGRKFGRKDTYAKHLKSARTRCVGIRNLDALYHSENLKKATRFRVAPASLRK